MNVFDFISKSDYAEIKQKVENRQEFDYKKTKGKITFTLHNSYAGCDFYGGKAKKGDYFISIGYDYGIGGRGCPLYVDEFLQYFENWESATKYIDGFFGRLEEYGYETLKNTVEQLTLF